MIKILLVDDHAIVRAGLRTMLDEITDLRVVSEAGDGRSALHLVDVHHPDVILLDIGMPGLNGLEALSRLRKSAPETGVVILSMYATEEYVVRAMADGALGYLVKDVSTEDLIAAIRAAARGECYLCDPLSAEVIEAYQQRLGSAKSIIDCLTPRELETLQLLAEGHSTRSIAIILGISPKTVETHRANLMDKLDLHDLASLTRLALRTGVSRE